MKRSSSAHDVSSLSPKDIKLTRLPLHIAETKASLQPRRGAANRLMMFIVVLVCFLWYFNYGYRLLRKREAPHVEEELLVLDSGFQQPVGANSIKQVHELGLPHVGINLFVLRRLHGPDNQIQLLLLKRSRKAVTCPLTWSILGEHSSPHEKAISTAARGLREELGVFSDDNTMMMVTTCVLEEQYAKSRKRSDRVDKQLTHLAFYEQDMRQVVDFDEDEVAAIKWITPKELYDMTLQSDRPFCTEAMAQLYRIGLIRMCQDQRLKSIGQCNLPVATVAPEDEHMCQDFDESYVAAK